MKTDRELMLLIGRRAMPFNSTWSQLEVVLNIQAVHDYIPIDLERLLNADDFNFVHDVFGIAKHLNRETRKLENEFRPRFTKKENHDRT